MHAAAARSTVPVPGQVTNTFFSLQTHPHTLKAASAFALGFTSLLPDRHMIMRINTGALMACTFHVDVNGGSLLAGLLQTDVATHVRGMGLGNVQR